MLKNILASFLLIMPNVLLAADTESYLIKFGILSEESKGRFFLIMEAEEIPNIPKSQGLAYGIEVTPPDELPYVVRMVAYLPDTPEKLSGVFSGMNPSAATKGLQFPEYTLTGKTAVPMGQDKGDPLGIYKLQVYINDVFIETIEYEVKLPD